MKYFFIYFIISLNISFAQTRLDNATIEEYLKLHSEFVKNVCTPGTEDKYTQLLREFQGDGNYIPSLIDEKIDLKTIKNILPLIDEKIIWLNTQIAILKEIKSFKDLREILRELRELNNELSQTRKKYFAINIKEDAKADLEKIAGVNIGKIIAKVQEFKNKAPFLLSFKFPIDHLTLRSDYEKVRESTDKEGRSKANSLFFYRKIVQDGSYDEESLKSDSMVRAVFDTLYISLTNNNKSESKKFFTEEERVDLNFLIRNFEILLGNTPKKYFDRMNEWSKRMQRSRDFYQNLLENKNLKISENSQLQDITLLLENRSKALYNLKDFSLSEQAKAYLFWSKTSELFQSLFTLETILYSEVGRSDENVGFFRQDVAQVVVNRSTESKFNQFGSADSLVKYLNKEVKTKDYPWLNVLFKEGEFSFTYFYIPGNLQIYCPDTSHIGKFLRKENLKISMKAIKNPRPDFKGIRYFSRVSMFGRISMDSIWNNFEPIAQEPGLEIKKNLSKLRDFYSKGNYRFLYDFEGADKNRYRVVEIKGASYVVQSSSENKFYTYRNPNLFKFFSFRK